MALQGPASSLHLIAQAQPWLDEIRLRRRARRVLILCAALWLLNGFDLVCTISARDIGGFHEQNPVARSMLESSPALVVLKLIGVTLASTIFIAYRRHRVIELACWGMTAIYVSLSLLWMTYYNILG